MHPKILRNFIYPFYRFLRRDKLLQKIKELEYNQWLSLDELKELQWQKLKRLIKYSYENVDYYRKLMDRENILPEDIKSYEDFKKFPILTKKKIKENFPFLISKVVKKKDLKKNSTGGSTGENLIFFNDITSLICRRANTIRKNRWCGVDIGDKEAFLWGAPFDIKESEKILSRIKNFFMNKIYLSSYNLSKESMRQYVEILIKFKPKLITAYPTPLTYFAEFLLENKINIIKPLAIIASAETLFDYQKNIIERAFGCPVFNRYGCREFGNIAQECEKHNGLHICIDRVFLEVLKDGKPAQPGELGEIIITDLDNYGMPFIRYRIEDMGILSDRECECGRGLPLLEKIEGRVYDLIKTPSGKVLSGTFWSFLSRAVNGIKQFQVIQNRIDRVIFKIVPEENFKKSSISYLKKEIEKHCGKDFKVDFQIVDKIPLTKSGKHRFIISKLQK